MTGSLTPPTRHQISGYARRRRLAISPEQLEHVRAELVDSLEVFRRLDELTDPAAARRHSDRDPGRVPTAGEDPYRAIIRFCEVKGSPTGPLAGWRIGIKDNIAVAGIEMTEGVPDLTTTPTEDAVVVERLLDAGATIVAKTNIETGQAAFGVTRNPRDPRFSAGGSSSGSAAAVAARIVDAAVGVDQGGSIRNPAAWCGIVGMKATHGLVPSYGLAYWDHTLDHIGPMTETVAANATMLQVMGGHDWRDPQWVRASPAQGSYTDAARTGTRGLRIGVVAEATGPAGCTPKTAAAFAEAREVLQRLGAEVIDVSVPLWRDAAAIWLVAITSRLMAMAHSYGQGQEHLGRIDVDRLITAADQYRRGIRNVPWLSPLVPLLFDHLETIGYLAYPGQAQNLRIALRRQVDGALEGFDVLITPTVTAGPNKIADEALSTDVEPIGLAQLASGMTNTAVNLTGHPALTVRSGPGDHDLPTGLQIIGRHFDEKTVYRVGFAFEAATQQDRTTQPQGGTVS